ncbi:MAG TPA: ribosome-associated translation inhibitor RaiA [Solirubrobacteraceae bacterium]|nr:ribosome-associated translation inhibitor RaiA [Solirubrobacteraceae bacterium]
MQIEVSGLNVSITDDLREQIERRFQKVARQVSDLATCEVILSEERNPAIKMREKVEASLQLKGVTLHAKAQATEFRGAIGDVVDELMRQVERRRDKVRKVSKTGSKTIRHGDVAVAEAEVAEAD